jgi:malonyl-CoA decarboxylase
VARFHFGNGARLERLNWLGDTSTAGLKRSAGLTANYLYSLPDVDANHRAYADSHTLAVAGRLESLAREAAWFSETRSNVQNL